ncbi:MAG: Ureidoglycolate hydrolase [Leifsonia xyli]|jgi:ureidoglycolate lyase|nr:MAG: Ureidoglycolate hydrolase [Leifsonia xyli]
MPSNTLIALPLNRDDFAPFGDVLDMDGDAPRPMNKGRASRYHALATPEVLGEGADVVISIAESEPVSGPLECVMVERHPDGSQAFMPLTEHRTLIVVCPDEGGRPGTPRAFVSAPGQGVNYHRNIWHGVLSPLDVCQSYLIVDRSGPGNNLEEHYFEAPWRISIR